MKLTRYNFAYQFIPMMVNDLKSDFRLIEFLINKTAMQTLAKHIYGDESSNTFDWDQLSIEPHKLNEQYIIVLFVFPEPLMAPEAKFGLIIADCKNDTNPRLQYYTLEHPGNDEHWFIGSIDNNMHINFGELEDEPNYKNFIAKTFEIFTGKESI